MLLFLCGGLQTVSLPVAGELLIYDRPAPHFSVCNSCYNAPMHNFVILFIHVIVTLSRLCGPGRIRSVAAESVLIKQQLLIPNRSRKRAPNLRVCDRFVAGLCSLFMNPTRLIHFAIVLKISDLFQRLIEDDFFKATGDFFPFTLVRRRKLVSMCGDLMQKADQKQWLIAALRCRFGQTLQQLESLRNIKWECFR
jgi:hypothetical protein